MSALVVEVVAAEGCGWGNPVACAGNVVGAVAGSVAGSAWEAVCRSFGEAAVSLLELFAKAFVNIGSVDLQSAGVRDVYSTSLGVAALVAAILLLVQIARTALTHEGSAFAYGLVGLGKAALAFMLTLTVAGTAVVVADEVTAFIVNRTFGSADGLRDKLGGLFGVAPQLAPSLLFVIALLCILIILLLWFELLMLNAAVVVLVATSPIAAVGQVSDTTNEWWPNLLGATIRLILLKPVIALVFALGLNVGGGAQDFATLMTGLVVLVLAVLAWPAIGRFFTFAKVKTGGGMGLAGLIGAGSNMANSSNGAPVGADPNQFSQTAEARTMGAHTGRAGATAGGSQGAAAGGGAGAATAGGAAAATGGAAIAVFAAKAALDAAQKGANALVGKSEQMAGHAGLDGANPYANPAGYPRHAAPTWPSSPGAEPAPTHHPDDNGDGDGVGGDDDPSPPPTAPRPPPDTVSPVQHQQPPQAQVVEPGRDGG